MSVLPGQTVAAPYGETCEDCGAAATKGIVGEVDSMGHETSYYCDEHHRQRKAEIASHNSSGNCEICTFFSGELVRRRDPNEGSCGRLYDMCPACARKMAEDFCDE